MEKTKVITVVNEPQAEYKVTSWRAMVNDFSFDEFIGGIENGIILYYPPSGSIIKMLPDKPKRKLSALRGKLTRQSEKEIDNRISDLRSEWDRNF